MSKECNKRWLKPVKVLIKKYPSLYQFYNGCLNKFILLLRKGVYSYEYMNSWERFEETSLPDKKVFYSEINIENITGEDYEHYQKLWKELEKKNLVSIIICMFNVIRYCLQMYLNILETNAWKFMDLTLLIFCLDQD